MIFPVKLLLLFTIFLIPLLGAVSGFGYEQVKVLFFLLSISLIGFIWLFAKPKFKWIGISKAGGIFIIVLAVTSLLGVGAQSSILGTDPYFQGWILYSYLYLFYLMVKEFKVGIKKYALVLSISALLVAFLAIKDWILLNIFHQQIPTYAGRVVSTFGQPNFYAGFLLLTLPFAYLLFKDPDKKMRYFGLISGLISIIGIFVSYSRSAILLSLGLLILALIGQLKIKFKLALIVISILLISIFVALKYQSGLVGSEVSKPISTHDPDLTKISVEKRIYIWPQALKISQQKFLTGYGLENIDPAFFRYFETNKHRLFEENLQISPVLISLKELYLDRTHNYLLDLLLFSGISGLLAWLFLVCLLFRKLIQVSVDRHKSVLVVSLITYLVWIQFQNQSIVHLLYFWFLAGLVDNNP